MRVPMRRFRSRLAPRAFRLDFAAACLVRLRGVSRAGQDDRGRVTSGSPSRAGSASVPPDCVGWPAKARRGCAQQCRQARSRIRSHPNARISVPLAPPGWKLHPAPRLLPVAATASRHGPTDGLFLHPPSPLEAGIEGNQQENQQDHEDGDQSFLPLETPCRRERRRTVTSPDSLLHSPWHDDLQGPFHSLGSMPNSLKEKTYPPLGACG